MVDVSLYHKTRTGVCARQYSEITTFYCILQTKPGRQRLDWVWYRVTGIHTIARNPSWWPKVSRVGKELTMTNKRMVVIDFWILTQVQLRIGSIRLH